MVAVWLLLGGSFITPAAARLLASPSLRHHTGVTSESSVESAPAIVPTLPQLLHKKDRHGRALQSTNTRTSIFGAKGSPLCPCLIGDDLPPVLPNDVPEDILEYITSFSNLTEFGKSGCATHEANSSLCQSQECDPYDADCEIAWCFRPYCYVDRRNCDLTLTPSLYFFRSSRYFSFATCGEIDMSTTSNLISTLEGQTLRVGLVENSGGWSGSYNPTGTHFEGKLRNWNGPMITLAANAASQGGYQIQPVSMGELNPELREKAAQHFKTTSPFDFCAFVTSLGFLDYCVGQFTVTNKRASSVEWIPLTSEPLYLVVQVTHENISTIGTVFRPFSTNTWFFLMFVVVPLLATLFFWHELQYLHHTKEERSHHTQGVHCEEHFQDYMDYFIEWLEAVYLFVGAILSGGFGETAVTWGGKLTVMALNVLGLITVACYTANLAAFLSQTDRVSSVDSFDAALRAGYRFCGSRNRIAEIPSIYGVPDDIFVVDPIAEGGDGLPGFSCCDPRARVLDFIDFERASAGDPRYCHAAIAPQQDLDVLQARRVHCNKTVIGVPVTFINTGMPVHESVSKSLVAFHRTLINEGQLDRAMREARPENRCPAADNMDESEIEPLTIEQLSGLWVLTGIFASLGVFLSIYYRKRPHKLISRGMVSMVNNVRHSESIKHLRSSVARKGRHSRDRTMGRSVVLGARKYQHHSSGPVSPIAEGGSDLGLAMSGGDSYVRVKNRILDDISVEDTRTTDVVGGGDAHSLPMTTRDVVGGGDAPSLPMVVNSTDENGKPEGDDVSVVSFQASADGDKSESEKDAQTHTYLNQDVQAHTDLNQKSPLEVDGPWFDVWFEPNRSQEQREQPQEDEQSQERYPPATAIRKNSTL